VLANIVRLEILDNNRTKDRLVISELALRTRTELDINDPRAPRRPLQPGDDPSHRPPLVISTLREAKTRKQSAMLNVIRAFIYLLSIQWMDSCFVSRLSLTPTARAIAIRPARRQRRKCANEANGERGGAVSGTVQQQYELFTMSFSIWSADSIPATY